MKTKSRLKKWVYNEGKEANFEVKARKEVGSKVNEKEENEEEIKTRKWDLNVNVRETERETEWEKGGRKESWGRGIRRGCERKPTEGVNEWEWWVRVSESKYTFTPQHRKEKLKHSHYTYKELLPRTLPLLPSFFQSPPRVPARLVRKIIIINHYSRKDRTYGALLTRVSRHFVFSLC